MTPRSAALRGRRTARAAAPSLLLVAALLGGATGVARAHEARPALLELTESTPGRFAVLWRTPVRAGRRLPVALELPDGVRGLSEPIVQNLGDSLVERRTIDAGRDGLAGKRIAIAGLELTITDVLVRVALADGRRFATIVRPARPWFEIAAAQGPLEVVTAYVGHGIEHIALGMDHLLFVLGLLLIVSDRWMLLKTVTAFTVAHSVTLALATFGLASAPVLPLNAAIALSILFLGPEVVRAWRGGTSSTIRRPWIVAFLFGLVHGFGFAGALTGAGLPPGDLPVALLGFNLGVEIGQVAFVVLVLLLERSFRRLEIRWPIWIARMPGYVVGSLGAFWTFERTAILFGWLR